MKMLLIPVIVAFISISGTYVYLTQQFQAQRIYDTSLESAIDVKAYINILRVLKQGDLQGAIGSVEGMLYGQTQIAKICVIEDCGRDPGPLIIDSVKKESEYEYEVYAP